jgi:hypothetical protein
VESVQAASFENDIQKVSTWMPRRSLIALELPCLLLTLYTLAPGDEPMSQPIERLGERLQRSALLGMAGLGFTNPFFDILLRVFVIKWVAVHKLLLFAWVLS